MHRFNMPARLLLLALLALGLLGAPETAQAGTRTVLILHTNDIHDHVRPGYRGQGGLPYIASYVRSVRAERDDVLLLDAGDVREKGDWVAHLTRGRLIFEAMGKIGYDAVAPGNHDIKDGMEHLDQCEAWLGQPFLCANILTADGSPRYRPSRVFEVNGVRMGVIGLTRADKGEAIPKLDFSKRVLAEESARLKDATDVLVGLVHEGGADALELAKAAPEIDVFITGHTHQTMHEPRVCEDTGAILVQSGSEAYYVGRLELTVDTARGEIIGHKGELIAMDHETIAPDPEIMAMVTGAEAKHCSEAPVVIARSERAVAMHEVAQLVAEALREALDADIALAMTDKVIRNTLPKGAIDNNAVFRALAPWALQTMTIELTGEELLAYLAAHAGTRDGPHWSGASLTFARDTERAYQPATTDIEPGRVYRVALTESEWERTLRGFLEDTERAGQKPSSIRTDAALRAYIAQRGRDDMALCAWARQCRETATRDSVASDSVSSE
jgi:2',3'-cyclic-nucleotide 2'-phosphodiesterase (5'-nucleotidase family)